jgi:hypothetical protein
VLNRDVQTGVLMIGQNKDPIFIPFVCSFQKIGMQGVHVTSQNIYVCFLTGSLFGYIDLKTHIIVAFQTRDIDYKYIIFANVSSQRISFKYDQEKLIISQA